jgi:hypothetical protein
MPLWQPRWSILPHAPKFNAPQEFTAVSALGWGGVLRHRLAERRFEHLYRAGDIGVFSGRLFLGGSRPEQKCLSKINETAAGQTRRSGAQTALLGDGGGPSPLWEAPVGSRAIRKEVGHRPVWPSFKVRGGVLDGMRWGDRPRQNSHRYRRIMPSFHAFNSIRRSPGSLLRIMIPALRQRFCDNFGLLLMYRRAASSCY